MEDLLLNDDEQINEIPNHIDKIESPKEVGAKVDCIVCSKSFNDTLQLAAHEQSKKHRQALKIKQKTTSETLNHQPLTRKKKRRAGKDEGMKKDKFACNVCKTGFPSKTKLFDHINETGHARA